MKDKLNSFTTKVSKTLFDTKMFLKNKGNKYPILFSLFGVILSSLSVVGITLSLWTKTASTGNNSISTGTITMKYVEDTNITSLDISNSMTANQAYQSNSYYPFQVAMTASGNATLDYEITVTTQNTTTLNYDTDEKVRIGLKKENVIVTDAGFSLEGSNNIVDYTNGVIVSTLPATGSNLNGNTQTIYKGTITSTGTETVHNFKLYIWLDSNAVVNDNDEKYALSINVNTGNNTPNYGNYTLTYVDNDGSGCTPSTKQVRRNSPWGELCSPNKDGYRFDGWYTSPNGSGSYINSSTFALSDQTVYANYTLKTLYAVLNGVSRDGVYAREYTGSHQDSMNATLSTHNIYHWYGTTAANGTAILDKNNVIFANHCWQMIRTTDTGGVRMIYNGEVVDGKCLNTRGNHAGYGSTGSHYFINTTYWYGTDYTSNNGTFSISGTTSLVEVTSSNASTIMPTLIGKYTCKRTSETDTCSNLYLIVSYDINSGYVEVLGISQNQHYSQIGSAPFNSIYTHNSGSFSTYRSPAHGGYMYNIAYQLTSVTNSYSVAGTQTSISLSNYYSDTISYNGSQYILTNPQRISSLSDISELAGKYMLDSGGNTSYSTARYITEINGTLIYFRSLKNGDLDTSMMIGDSYVDNGNGTYTLQNPTSISYLTWYNSNNDTRNMYKYKYVCDGTSVTCSNLKRIYSTSKISYYYFQSSDSNKYGEGISYSNGAYTLTGDIKELWDFADNITLSQLATHRYTCASNNTTCDSVRYVPEKSNENIRYLILNGVSSLSAAITNMFYANNVNTYDANVKFAVDLWYKNNLLSYDNYIDDTIYCNNRNIKQLGGWEPTGPLIGDNNESYLVFEEYNNTTADLSCSNVTDKFSVSNNSAKLAYKVGLLSLSELLLLNQDTLRATGKPYWLMSPGIVKGIEIYEQNIEANGTIKERGASVSAGVRPVISLKANVEYSSGDGSMANPYVVDTD